MSLLRPILGALDTFVRQPGETTPRRGPQIRDVLDMKRALGMVLIALMPCVAWAFYRYGFETMVPLFAVSYGVGLAVEVVFASVRGGNINEGYFVTGMLIPLIVPATIPLWQLALAVAFAVVFAKEVFGGTGYNIFNPALVCRAFLFFAYPAQMSGDVWTVDAQPVADGQEQSRERHHGWWLATSADALSGPTPWVEPESDEQSADALSGPTPLAVAAAADGGQTWRDLESSGYDRHALFVGKVPGSPGEVSKIAILLGAAFLIVTGVAALRIMIASALGLLIAGFIVHLVNPDGAGLFGLAPWDHFLVGGFLFGLVFMITDPVTTPETRAGKWVCGLLFGALTVLIRVFNPAYPEGTMLAILLMNAFSPAIDRAVLAVNIRRRRRRHA